MKCAACDTSTKDTWICKNCHRYTSRELGNQEAHRRELVTSLTRLIISPSDPDKLGTPTKSGGNTAALEWLAIGDRELAGITAREIDRLIAGLPPAKPAGDALHSQRSLLVSWCRLIIDEGIGTGYPAETVAAMSCYIEHHLRALVKHECVGELVHELRQLRGEIMRAVDTPRVWKFPAGPCFMVVDGTECPGQVWGHGSGDDEEPVLRCKVCGHEWDSTQFIRAGKKILERKGAA